MLGGFIAVVVVLYNIYYFMPSVFRWDTSLPLHICDLLGIACVLALFTRLRIARTFVYFFALPLASQAVITPVGNQDPTLPRFWLYWLLHTAILACSLYDLSVRNYRPTRCDFLHILGVDLCYVLLIVPLNVMFSWSYGYLGNVVPETDTAINLLGPWPWRILTMIAAGLALQTVMMIPWWIFGRKNNEFSGPLR